MMSPYVRLFALRLSRFLSVLFLVCQFTPRWIKLGIWPSGPNGFQTLAEEDFLILDTRSLGLSAYFVALIFHFDILRASSWIRSGYAEVRALPALATMLGQVLLQSGDGQGHTVLQFAVLRRARVWRAS